MVLLVLSPLPNPMGVPTSGLWLFALIYGSILLGALLRVPWHRLDAQKSLSVFLGTTVALLVLWSIRADIGYGLEFHLLGVATVTLMFGWPLAILTVSLAQLGLTLNGAAAWSMYPLETLVHGVLPVFCAYAVLRASERWLPPHFFIYIFVCAFFGGALTMAISHLAAVASLLAEGAQAPTHPGMHSALILPLMMLPEAFLNGMLMTLLVAYKPHWVMTFDDNKYLRGR